MKRTFLVIANKTLDLNGVKAIEVTPTSYCTRHQACGVRIKFDDGSYITIPSNNAVHAQRIKMDIDKRLKETCDLYEVEP